MLQMTGTKLTRQILSFVAFCLILAEIVIFVPSASHFQYRWFETQWQHFLVQFDKDSESDISALASSYRATAKINHDLRKILVSATLVTDMLGASDDPKIRRIAPHIERAISDAAGMTQNMMDYLTEAKPETARPFCLGEMANNLHHDAKLDVTGTKTLFGTPNMLYRLLLNLARNAKAAGASALTIDVWWAGHLAVIDITDDGPGIDKALKPHLF